MSYNLILVGGTGQQFGSVLGWMNLMGLITPPTKTVVVDANLSSTTPNMINNLRYANPTHEYIHFRPYHTGGGNVTLRDAILTNEATSPLMKLLFTERERMLPLANGFYANPKLGATVFSYLQKTDNIVDRVRAGNQGPIGPTMIVGSVAGGTGAGLMYSIARQFFDARGSSAQEMMRSPITGFIFSKFMLLNEDDGDHDVTNAQLSINAQNGVRFLWRRSQDDPNFPFDMIDLFGPPENDNHVEYCPSIDTGSVLPFPGFLLAANQLAKNGPDFWESLRVHLGNAALNPDGQNQRFLGIYAHAVLNGEAVRGTNSYLRGTNLVFNGLFTDDIPVYLNTLRSVLDEVKKYDIKTALSPFALWPLRRLPKEIVDFLREGGGKISRGQISDAFRSLHEIPRNLTENLFNADKNGTNTFSQWFNQLSSYGYSSNQINESPRVQRTEWHKHLTQIANLDPDSSAKLIQTICTAQITAVDHGNTRPEVMGAARWAFPYIREPRPPETGRHNLNDHHINMEDRHLVGGSGVCFPTPLGRVEAFKVDLLNSLNEADSLIYREAKMLWYGLALGFIKMETVTLSEGTNLENIISKFERMETINILKDTTGNIIGGTHPECGVWSGVEGIRDPKLLNLINNISLEVEALVVLSYWLEEVQERILGAPPVWLRFLSNLVQTTPHGHLIQERKVDIRREDLGTHASVKLSIGGARTTSMYFYVFSPLRQHIAAHLIYSLVDDEHEIHSRLITEHQMRRIDCVFHGEVIASISLGSVNNQYTPDTSSRAVEEGCFALTLSDKYPISAIRHHMLQIPLEDALLTLIRDKWPSMHGVNLLNVYNHIKEKEIFKPEIFWFQTQGM